MGKEKRVSLEDQVKTILAGKCAFQQDNSSSTKDDVSFQYIYNKSTYDEYLRCCIGFVKWVRKDQRYSSDLEATQRYINGFLRSKIDRNLSPLVLRLEAQALAMLFGRTVSELLEPLVELKQPTKTLFLQAGSS